MTQIATLTTSKLFYGKWPFKLVVSVERASWLKMVQQTPSWKSKRDLQDVKTVAKLLEAFDSKEYATRGEHTRVSIFFKDIELKDKFIDTFGDRCLQFWKPDTDEELQTLVNNGRKVVIKNHLFKRKYRFKVTFKPAASDNERISVKNWMQNNRDRFDANQSASLWLEAGHKRWWNASYYLYVTDDKSLAMLVLSAGNAIKLIEEVKLRTEINTQSG